MKRPFFIRMVLALILAAAVIWVLVYRDRLDIQALESWVESAGLLAPVVFMLTYAATTVLLFPGSVITMVGGALFGPVWGTLYSLLGATAGATLAFFAARYLAADWVAEKSGRRLGRLIKGVEAEGWRFVALTRLVPLFPFNLLNYALGLTRIPPLHYVLATFICMAPGGLAYAYLGYAGREALAGGEGAIRKSLLALGLIAMVVFLPRLIKRLRRGSKGTEKDETGSDEQEKNL